VIWLEHWADNQNQTQPTGICKNTIPVKFLWLKKLTVNCEIFVALKVLFLNPHQLNSLFAIKHLMDSVLRVKSLLDKNKIQQTTERGNDLISVRRILKRGLFSKKHCEFSLSISRMIF
jgi:hypothetical protein